MKKQILIPLVTLASLLLTVNSAFAEREMSKLQYVETQSCSSAELQKTIFETADRVFFADTNLTTLEDGLGITAAQKASGIYAEVLKTAPRSSLRAHVKTVAKAELAAKAGRVGITAPAKFDVVYVVKDANDKRINAGRVQLDVTCRVETITKDGQESIRHTGQLVSFDVKAKGK